jgi:hypothetical protein
MVTAFFKNKEIKLKMERDKRSCKNRNDIRGAQLLEYQHLKKILPP